MELLRLVESARLRGGIGEDEPSGVWGGLGYTPQGGTFYLSSKSPLFCEADEDVPHPVRNPRGEFKPGAWRLSQPSLPFADEAGGQVVSPLSRFAPEGYVFIPLPKFLLQAIPEDTV